MPLKIGDWVSVIGKEDLGPQQIYEFGCGGTQEGHFRVTGYLLWLKPEEVVRVESPTMSVSNIQHVTPEEWDLLRRAVGEAINLSEEMGDEGPFNDDEHEALCEAFWKLWPKEKKDHSEERTRWET